MIPGKHIVQAGLTRCYHEPNFDGCSRCRSRSAGALSSALPRTASELPERVSEGAPGPPGQVRASELRGIHRADWFGHPDAGTPGECRRQDCPADNSKQALEALARFAAVA